MGVVLVLGVVLGSMCAVSGSSRRPWPRSGGRAASFAYDWQWGDRKPEMFIYTREAAGAGMVGEGRPGGLRRQRVMVDLDPSACGNRPNPADEKRWRHVGRLGHLESLELSGTAITDAGLAHLKGLTGLRRSHDRPDPRERRRAGSPRRDGQPDESEHLRRPDHRRGHTGPGARPPGSGSTVSKSGPTPTHVPHAHRPGLRPVSAGPPGLHAARPPGSVHGGSPRDSGIPGDDRCAPRPRGRPTS